MSYQYYNPNPNGKFVKDCVIRALSFALSETWDRIFIELSMQAFMAKDRIDADSVWGSYLYSKGFRQHLVYDICPDCYTVRDFCIQHPKGLFVLSTGDHVVTVYNGKYYDSWDSGSEHPIYYWRKE